MTGDGPGVFGDRVPADHGLELADQRAEGGGPAVPVREPGPTPLGLFDELG